jgi:hypothetical protein
MKNGWTGKLPRDCKARGHFHMQGDAGHPGKKGGGQAKNNWKKVAEVEDRYSG